jgi:hypothetical protein
MKTYTNDTFTAGDRTPYTYLIVFKVTGQVYYGVKYSKFCNPKQLGVKYFSSSSQFWFEPL